MPLRPSTELYYAAPRLSCLIKLLDQSTADGFVYRVDTAAAAVRSERAARRELAAFESYLVQHGRDWERYAYVKARLHRGAAISRSTCSTRS